MMSFDMIITMTVMITVVKTNRAGTLRSRAAVTHDPASHPTRATRERAIHSRAARHGPQAGLDPRHAAAAGRATADPAVRAPPHDAEHGRDLAQRARGSGPRRAAARSRRSPQA